MYLLNSFSDIFGESFGRLARCSDTISERKTWTVLRRTDEEADARWQKKDGELVLSD